MRSQLNRGRRLISAFVPALARWRASRARMFHSWRHRSGLSNEAAILIPRFGGSNPPAAASLYASARVEPPLFGDPVTHHTTDAQPITKSARSPQALESGGNLGAPGIGEADSDLPVRVCTALLTTRDFSSTRH